MSRPARSFHVLTRPSLPLVALAVGSALLLACGGGGAHDASDDGDPAPGSGGEEVASLAELAERAVSEDETEATRAIAALRAAGREGHEALLAAHAEAIAALRVEPPRAPDAATERLRHAIDVVAAQRDGHASGLYWHTDLDAARREARERGVPILSLRLLGRLDEELSCANSRYFRLVLYANEELSAYLREHYVLHWSSERPVPRVTIDMGDGRVLERTLTGNSVHYVLDAEGRVLDAIPGLYGPREMLALLRWGHAAHASHTGTEGTSALAALRRAALEDVLARLDRARADQLAIPPFVPGGPSLAAPSALVAMPLTVSKLAVEGPLLDALRAPGTDGVARGAVDWSRAATQSYGRDPGSVLDARSRALLRLKTGRDDPAAAELVSALSRTVLGDSARNDATFRPRLLEWLLAEGEPPALEAFNERVYRDLFLTPAADPWLGLQDPTVWDAIERIH